MNNIVKIILGLNIAAGGAGIFFGITKSGKVGAMKQAKMDAEGKAATAMKDKRDAEEKFTAEAEQVTKLKGDNANLTLANDNLKKTASDSQSLINKANKAAGDAIIDRDKEKAISQSLQQVADKVPDLEGKLTDYENLGSPQDIKDGLDRLAKLEAATAPATKKNVPKKTNPGEVGTIQSHDPQNDFYVINVGSDNGINMGDEFTIFRAGKAIGKIEIGRAQPTVSIAICKKGFPKPPAPFKSGDKVMKIN